MGSEDVVRFPDDSELTRDSPVKKKLKKVPKRIHKSEREKQKREHLNDLFFELSDTLDLKPPNNGKASVLCECTRLLKDLLAQIECLRKENVSLLSESHYVTVETNELKEENSTLETQIGNLQNELEASAVQSKPDLNAVPLDCLAMPSQESGLSQHHAVFVLPIHSNPQPFGLSKSSHVSKPHARYPTSQDSWPPQLLRGLPKSGSESGNDSNCNV